MKNYRVYGNENVNLTLTDKAFRFVSMTDPLEIREFTHEREIEDETGSIIDIEKTYTYDLVGCVEAHDMTAQELNELLEELLQDESN